MFECQGLHLTCIEVELYQLQIMFSKDHDHKNSAHTHLATQMWHQNSWEHHTHDIYVGAKRTGIEMRTL